MNKKIIAIVALMLVLVFVFAACKKEEYKPSYTVPVGDGEVIEVYEDEDGSEFVTNMDGDKIPLTTDKDGFMDDVKDLVTATTTTTTKPAPSTSGTSGSEESTSSSTTTTTTTTTTTNETTTKTQLEVGGEKVTKEDSISIDEILGRK